MSIEVRHNPLVLRHKKTLKVFNAKKFVEFLEKRLEEAFSKGLRLRYMEIDPHHVELGTRDGISMSFVMRKLRNSYLYNREVPFKYHRKFLELNK